MKTLKYFLMLFAVSTLIWSCGDDEPTNLTFSSISAVGTSFENGAAVTKDLNGASSAIDVPLDASITITFDRAVDGASVSDNSVKITDASGTVASAVTSSGSSVTIKPTSDLSRGTLYTLVFSGLKASDGGTLTNSSRTFTTEGRAPVVVPNAANMLAYWPFDGDANEASKNYATSKVESIIFSEDRFGQGNSTATFDGDKSIIEIAAADQLLAGNDFTLSFWVKTNSDGHVNADNNPTGHFVLGLAAFKGFQFEIPGDYKSCKLAATYELANGDKVAEDTWFPGNGQDKDNGGWQGWDYVADLTGSGGVEGLIKDKWAHIICTYNSTEKQGRMYINGDLMKSFDFDLWPAGDAKQSVVGVGYNGVAPSELPELAFGFIHSSGGTLWDTEPWGGYEFPTANHFKGQLDDVRIFDKAYTGADAKALYDAEKN